MITKGQRFAPTDKRYSSNANGTGSTPVSRTRKIDRLRQEVCRFSFCRKKGLSQNEEAIVERQSQHYLGKRNQRGRARIASKGIRPERPLAVQNFKYGDRNFLGSRLVLLGEL